MHWSMSGLTSKDKTAGKKVTGSKYLNIVLVILAGLFTFGAPYVAFMASDFLKRGVFFSFTGGFLSLAIGLVLIWYLIKRKIIS